MNNTTVSHIIEGLEQTIETSYRQNHKLRDQLEKRDLQISHLHIELSDMEEVAIRYEQALHNICVQWTSVEPMELMWIADSALGGENR